jgi:hypothetical protein
LLPLILYGLASVFQAYSCVDRGPQSPMLIHEQECTI